MVRVGRQAAHEVRVPKPEYMRMLKTVEFVTLEAILAIELPIRGRAPRPKKECRS